MTYIDDLAEQIFRLAEPGERCLTSVYRPLYRIYALLSLVKGHYTTAEDVHDAWSVWQLGISSTHRSLVPFDELTSECQVLDEPYVTAIHRATALANNTHVLPRGSWLCARCVTEEQSRG